MRPRPRLFLRRSWPPITAGAALLDFAGANGEADLAHDHGYFAWYELITTGVAAAATFYRDVIGWETREASTPQFPYVLFMAGEDQAAGLMALAREGRQKGAGPRWVGVVGAGGTHAAPRRIKHACGGADV